MKYAVVTTGGKQYKVVEGQVLEVDKIQAEAGTDYTFENVLLTVDGDTIEVGAPFLSGVSVVGKVLEHVKGDKIRVAKFKAKARYRKVQGFRPHLTRIEITSLSQKSEKKTAAKSKE